MARLTLTALNVHPLKSAAGVAVDGWPVDDFGLAHDRRWMLVDRDGVFLSQRKHPRMALLRAGLDGAALTLRGPGAPPLRVEPPEDGPVVEVRVWADLIPARAAGAAADAWVSAALGLPCRLVWMPPETRRPVERGGSEWSRVSFADAYPFLLLTDASLADLNARLAAPVPMNRFRPNLVIGGAEPFAEDGWRRLRIGGIELELVKPCARCVLTTVDQATGLKGVEPLRTLARYRTVDREVRFGMNAVHRASGRLAVGDPVEILE